MQRLLIHVEGQTEEAFVNDLLRDHLVEKGYSYVGARLVGAAGSRSGRGGARAWPAVRNDLKNQLNQDGGSIAATMVDFYALPRTGDRAWPGRAEADTLRGETKATHVEEALLEDLARVMGPKFKRERFIPFVVLHEFEALLFSDCAGFSRGIDRPDLEPELFAIRAQFASPEDINDSEVTAPSKRVLGLHPGYHKVRLGVLAARAVGLPRIRQDCPHFNRWLGQLESVAQQLP